MKRNIADHENLQASLFDQGPPCAALLKAIDAMASRTTAAQRQLELALQQARYETAHARRQYDAVDPANRLVAGELERHWNEALEKKTKLEREIAAHEAEKPRPLGEAERAQLRSLGADLQRAWSHPAATAATRKRTMRAYLNEIIVRKEGAIIVKRRTCCPRYSPSARQSRGR